LIEDRYRQGFLEEARELLGELESSLLELDEHHEDISVVDRAFRALHTIKGSGAMFGFDDIAAFAHDLESAFDKLRKGELSVTASLINLALAAGDQIKTMLDAEAGGVSADTGRAASMAAELNALIGVQKPDGPPKPTTRNRPADEGPKRQWRIRFRPGYNVIVNGTNPILLFRELREMGEFHVQLDASGIPSLAQIDPERCYAAWDIVLTTAADRRAIQDVFIFIEDDCELDIELVGEQASADAAESTPPPNAASPAVRASIGTASVSSIRVSAEKLDQLVNLVGELVTVQARLSALSARRNDPDILEISEEVDRLTTELRENSMSIRMLPLRSTFERFRRLVHDLSLELNKNVELAIEGADTELDKTVIDQLNDPLVHLIRNSMDHGIESREARLAAGKPATATIRISALHAGAQVLISVSDDGAGLDAQAVRARAIEQRLIDASTQLSESELYSLIMAPGFSTARKVTDISGRGVGMDVVRRSVEALRGTIEMSSKQGAGLTVTLRLPLTLAIIDGLLVRVGDTYFVLPLASSLECVELTRKGIEETHGNHLANVRGEIIPYIRLSEYFGIGSPAVHLAQTQSNVAVQSREQIMVVDADGAHYGLVVDEVLGNHQTVIKNLGRLYRDVQVVSGATILGNGTVALILDPHRLVQSAVQMNTDNRRAERNVPLRRSEAGPGGRDRMQPAGM